MAGDVLTIALAPGVPSYRQRTVLDGAEYVLELRWSAREARWYLDLRDVNDRPLVLAMKLVANGPLLDRFRTVEGLPPGELVAVDTRTPPRDPGLHELGAEVALVYFEAAAVAERVGGAA